MHSKDNSFFIIALQRRRKTKLPDQKNRFRLFAFLFLLFFVSGPALLHAQNGKDSTGFVKITGGDSAKQDSLVKMPRQHTPKTAAILSACLPGAGQIYNGRWWKVPIIYAGFAGFAYMLHLNQDSINHINVGIRERVADTLPSLYDYAKYPGYSTDQLVTIKRYYQRYRDISVMGIGFLYVLNIVDATVDAHLRYFDVSDNLSMRIHPRMLMTPGGTFYPSCTISLQLH